MTPWYKVVTLRREVREGRSFSPDEFAIALEQVVAGTAPEDYCDPVQFFSRTCFTRALNEHVDKVLRRLSGKTENTSPVLTLVTQFGGGKTHILTSLYHIAKIGANASNLPGIPDLLRDSNISEIPSIRVGVFVGNAWDPAKGKETPWIDLARQVAGDQGVEALGPAALTVAPGTAALSKVFATADAPVLLLFDEVLNFVNRHRNMAESFHAFIQNLSVAVTGTERAVAVISLPRSQVEMTDSDQQWQEKITKVVRRVSRDLFANDESEISEVICRRLFEDRGNVQMRKKIAKIYAEWCFERRDRLPQEWLTSDTALKNTKVKDHLAERFEACYPFHPAVLSVFQRKWRALSQFQQTRGTLAMLAQWISAASQKQFRNARKESLITLGSAPLDVPEFRAVVLGQLGESLLDVAIDADIAGRNAHAQALDAVAPKDLRDIHRRVGTAILFESSGGQVNKVAQLPELRFALGETAVDITAIDNAATALEKKGYFVRKVGAGYKIHHQATLKKVVNDRRASLNVETEIKPAIRELVQKEFRSGAALPVFCFPENSSSVQDTPRLILAILDPETEWSNDDQVIQRISQWTTQRGQSPRLYSGSLVWCAKATGRKLREKVEWWLAWRTVEGEINKGLLGAEFDSAERANVHSNVRDAAEAAKNEVWASYRFVVLSDPKEDSILKVIDLGAGHSSSQETLCGRVISALKSEGLLNENVGAGYIDRNWPDAFTDEGAWPLLSLRKNFLDGSLTRLADPEKTLRTQIARFVSIGEFGLGYSAKDGGGYSRVWYNEPIPQEEIVFETDVFLLTKTRAISETIEPIPDPEPDIPADQGDILAPSPVPSDVPSEGSISLKVVGTMPSETWNRFGIKVIPKLRSLQDLHVRIDISSKVNSANSQNMKAELRRALDELDLGDQISIE
ncbi:MAG: DUF499 domain-containing protein [Bacteroidetes bacterium]|nr:DUF499 domain-containing protein [Bacteroidota bacterium]